MPWFSWKTRAFTRDGRAVRLVSFHIAIRCFREYNYNKMGLQDRSIRDQIPECKIRISRNQEETMLNREILSTRQPGIIGEEQFRQYAVLVPLIEEPEGISLLFEKRSSTLKRQPGEICFPGGKLEPGESQQECAVRETMEELLVSRNQIEVLGPGDVFVSPFNLMVHPFIGSLRDYENTFSTEEVAEIIRIPLKFFRNHQPEKYESRLINEPPKDFPYEWIPGGEKYPWAKGKYDILFYRHEEQIIWGMTARILKSVLELIDR